MLRFGTCLDPPDSFVLLGCILTRGENRWQEKRRVSWVQRLPFEASSHHHLSRCAFCPTGLLSSWFKSQRKESVTFKYSYEENASSLRKRRGWGNRWHSHLIALSYSGLIVWRERKQFRERKKKDKASTWPFFVLARNSFIFYLVIFLMQLLFFLNFT